MHIPSQTDFPKVRTFLESIARGSKNSKASYEVGLKHLQCFLNSSTSSSNNYNNNSCSNDFHYYDIETTNGPDLYVYLATDNSASDFVNLGRLKGNIGNQNYDIPIGIDLSRYDSVLIWCPAFSVLFGSAELEPQQ